MNRKEYMFRANANGAIEIVNSADKVIEVEEVCLGNYAHLNLSTDEDNIELVVMPLYTIQVERKNGGYDTLCQTNAENVNTVFEAIVKLFYKERLRVLDADLNVYGKYVEDEVYAVGLKEG